MAKKVANNKKKGNNRMAKNRKKLTLADRLAKLSTGKQLVLFFGAFVVIGGGIYSAISMAKSVPNLTVQANSPLKILSTQGTDPLSKYNKVSAEGIGTYTSQKPRDGELCVNVTLEQYFTNAQQQSSWWQAVGSEPVKKCEKIPQEKLKKGEIESFSVVANATKLLTPPNKPNPDHLPIESQRCYVYRARTESWLTKVPAEKISQVSSETRICYGDQ